MLHGRISISLRRCSVCRNVTSPMRGLSPGTRPSDLAHALGVPEAADPWEVVLLWTTHGPNGDRDGPSEALPSSFCSPS